MKVIVGLGNPGPNSAAKRERPESLVDHGLSSTVLDESFEMAMAVKSHDRPAPEIADEKLAPGDLNEDLIHSLQKHVEVDEPEAEAAPPMVASPENGLEVNADAQFDRMTEEDLLRGLEGMAPPPEPEDEGE